MKSVDEILKNVADEATARMNIPTSSSVNPSGPHERDGAALNKRQTASLLDDTCPRCGGVGFVTLDLPMGHPDFGKAVPCSCRERERLQKRVKSLQERSSLVALQRLTIGEMGDATGFRLPASVIDIYQPGELLLFGLGGLLIAVLGALLPAGWAAGTRTANALRTE